MTPLATFIDTTTPQLITLDGSFTGAIAYVDGDFAWPVAEMNRFVDAGKHLYRISVTGAIPRDASFIDCENGDLSPRGAAKYVAARNDLEGDGGVYCNRSTVPAVVQALGPEPAWLWCADWTGQPHTPVIDLPPHIRLCMVQYANLPNHDRDLNAVYSADWLAGRHIS